MGHAVVSLVTSGAEAVVEAEEEELVDQEVGVRRAEIAAANEISEIEETTRHHFGTSGAGNVMSTGAARGTVSAADEDPQAREGRLLGETFENANWQ